MHKPLVFVILMVAFKFGCAEKGLPAEKNSNGLIEGTGFTVTVKQLSDDEWSAVYQFSKPQTAVFFSRSRANYRLSTWRAFSDGAHLERVGGFDTVWFDAPQTIAEFRFTPYTGLIIGDYSPFIAFSDGGLALYIGQFEVLLAESKSSIEMLAGDIDKTDAEQVRMGVRVLSDQRMVFSGVEATGEVVDVSLGGAGYVYIGDGLILEHDSYIAVLDKGLPSWIKKRLDAELGLISQALEALYRQPLSGKSTIFFAYGGAEQQGISTKGGAMNDNLLVLQSSGTLLAEESTRVTGLLRDTFAHELAHLYQWEGAHGANMSDRWITEGGADAAKNYVLRALNYIDNSEMTKRASQAFKECSGYLHGGVVLNAPRRGKRAHYACGELVAYISDSAMPKHRYFDLWRSLVENASETETGRRFTTQMYFNRLAEFGVNDALITELKRFLSETLEQPAETLKMLMTAAGLQPDLDKDAKLLDVNIPLIPLPR